MEINIISYRILKVKSIFFDQQEQYIWSNSQLILIQELGLDHCCNDQAIINSGDESFFTYELNQFYSFRTTTVTPMEIGRNAFTAGLLMKLRYLRITYGDHGGGLSYQ